MTFDQAEFDVRCEWGLRGLQELVPVSDVVLIIDVLSFSTTLDIATAQGAIIFPYPMKGPAAKQYAASLNADLAAPERGSRHSLSPASWRDVPAGHRFVLPSPNGSALAFATHHPNVLAACLRNATAASQLAARIGSTFAVIPAGETWPAGELRPALEDWIGAGAVIASLPGSRSPEANLAALSFEHLRDNLSVSIAKLSSGKELIERGFSCDVDLACQLNLSRNVPRLRGAGFTADSAS